MLAELMLANQAFAIIKETLKNTGDVLKAGNAIADFVGAEDALRRKAKKKQNSFWTKVSGKATNDLEEFMALEQIREQEEQLRQMMIYLGRPGLWSDWQKFQAKARVARREAEEERIRKRKMYFEIAIVTFLLIVGLTILAAVVILALHSQGRI